MKKRIGKYEIEVSIDDNSLNPRVDYDNMGTMVCFHNKYILGDKHEYDSDDFNGWDDMEKSLTKEHDICVILPLYLYNHSGLTINTIGFSSPFDSGKIGFIYVSKETVRKEYNVKRINKKLIEKVTERLIGEVKTYDDYLTGNCYGYEINEIIVCNLGHEHKVFMDSCGGFLGDEDYCMTEAESVVQYYLNSDIKDKELELNFTE